MNVVYRNAAADPRTVKQAVQVMELLIENFGTSTLFGREKRKLYVNKTNVYATLM